MALVDLTGQTREVDHSTSASNIGWEFVREPEPGSTILGGRVLGVGANRTLPWNQLHGLANGAAIRWEVDNLTIRRNFNEFCWDPLKPRGSAPVVEECWIREGRDDGIEHDAVNSLADNTLTVRRCFFDSGHTFLSVSPGQSQPLDKPVLVVWEDCVMSLGHHLDGGRPAETREKRLKYAWSDATHGSGQAFKVRGLTGGGGDGITVRFNRNNVMLRYGLNTAKSNLRFFQDMAVEGSGNVFFYLGDFKGLTPVSFKGGMVPEEFALATHADVWDRVSNDAAEWEAVKARWEAEVWLGEPAPPPPPPPPPPPDPECDCVALQAEIDALDVALEAAEDALLEEQARRQALEDAARAARDVLSGVLGG